MDRFTVTVQEDHEVNVDVGECAAGEVLRGVLRPTPGHEVVCLGPVRPVGCHCSQGDRVRIESRSSTRSVLSAFSASSSENECVTTLFSMSRKETVATTNTTTMATSTRARRVCRPNALTAQRSRRGKARVSMPDAMASRSRSRSHGDPWPGIFWACFERAQTSGHTPFPSHLVSGTVLTCLNATWGK